MNRPIKFRVWDKKKNQWFKPIYKAYKGELEEVLISPSGHILFRTIDKLDATDKVQERFVLQQYTGLKDKNGRDVFEGDIITGHTYVENDNDAYEWTKENPVVVEWIEKEAGFYPFTLNNRWRCDVVDIKVIGNKFETPELLKEGK